MASSRPCCQTYGLEVIFSFHSFAAHTQAGGAGSHLLVLEKHKPKASGLLGMFVNDDRRIHWIKLGKGCMSASESGVCVREMQAVVPGAHTEPRVCCMVCVWWGGICVVLSVKQNPSQVR